MSTEIKLKKELEEQKKKEELKKKEAKEKAIKEKMDTFRRDVEKGLYKSAAHDAIDIKYLKRH